MGKALIILLMLCTMVSHGQTATTKRLVITQTVSGYVVMDSAAFKKYTDSVTAKAQRIVRDSLRNFRRIETVNGEVPTGIVNTVNKVFSLAAIPLPNTLRVYADGLRVYDYTMTTTTVPRRITTKYPPKSWLRVDYEYLIPQ